MAVRKLVEECIRDIQEVFGGYFVCFEGNEPVAEAGEPKPLPGEAERAHFLAEGTPFQIEEDAALFRAGETDLVIVCGCREAEKAGGLAVREIARIYAAARNTDRGEIVASLLEGKLSSQELESLGRRFHLSGRERYGVLLIRSLSDQAGDVEAVLHSILANRPHDHVLSREAGVTAVLLRLEHQEREEDLFHFACVVSDTISAEILLRTRIACGGIAENPGAIPRACREARETLQIMEIFYPEKVVLSFGKLGAARLIFGQPEDVCERFLNEIFGSFRPDELDSELLAVVHAMLENDLNLAGTSRRLFLHRNTLVYRLDKIQRASGLDLRRFDDALRFRLGMMVFGYLVEKRKQKS